MGNVTMKVRESIYIKKETNPSLVLHVIGVVAENFPNLLLYSGHLKTPMSTNVHSHLQLYAESTISLSKTIENGVWLLQNFWK